ncbi:hypothetical protein IC220_02640 [Wolbachia endosymbiont of Pentalonia nigronervosa]|jgi:hypothetical protein|uniref:hypothetical protein n=1 Tax=Wolbachia endosymbiont of Pentalonia nigronervosa TaxID=1301914 RepID=UPI00165FD9DE|nr:hypothetical protein [Wolbachia endosymbiont of Pentalonia nigronervosa]MBD0391356.1 hypothetical protein [Wolbachia endosymbiont of Pentalonia nigronervosa]
MNTDLFYTNIATVCDDSGYCQDDSYDYGGWFPVNVNTTEHIDLIARCKQTAR